MSLINEEDISTFNWKEPHGKDVKVLVYEEEGVQVAALYDNVSEEFFIVSVKLLEGGK